MGEDFQRLFKDLAENPTEYDYSQVTGKIFGYLNKNGTKNIYAKNVWALIDMDYHLINGGFPSYGYSTHIYTSGGIEREGEDIKLLDNFLNELGLKEISNYLLTSYEAFISYEFGIVDTHDPENNDEGYEKIDEFYTIYCEKRFKIQKKLFHYCDENLEKILKNN